MEKLSSLFNVIKQKIWIIRRKFKSSSSSLDETFNFISGLNYDYSHTFTELKFGVYAKFSSVHPDDSISLFVDDDMITTLSVSWGKFPSFSISFTCLFFGLFCAAQCTWYMMEICWMECENWLKETHSMESNSLTLFEHYRINMNK